MRVFDIGANLTDPMFQGIYHGTQKHASDLLNVLRRSSQMNITDIMITAGCEEDLIQSLSLLDGPLLADIKFCTTVGIHPTQAAGKTSESFDILFTIFKNINSKKRGVIRAIGECGLDYDRLSFAPKQDQLWVFEQHLKHASLFDNLPFFFHLRNAFDDFYVLLKKYRLHIRGGVVHSFDGTVEEAMKLIDLDLYIGLNGCSFKESTELARDIPLERLMVDSDAPWCSIKSTSPATPCLTYPLPFKAPGNKWNEESGVKGRNEPWAAFQVLQVIANVKHLPLEDVVNVIYANTILIFGDN